MMNVNTCFFVRGEKKLTLILNIIIIAIKFKW